MEYLIKVEIHEFKISKDNLIDYGMIIWDPEIEESDKDPIIKLKK